MKRREVVKGLVTAAAVRSIRPRFIARADEVIE